ncbi:MAG: phospholipase D-like domain-containing protein, partial [Bacteroidales bacterium]|nr:phospholipase D-like domain-containing protein [Bacteroidales bacterium]
MNQAKSVDIVVYSISNPAIVDSILAAHKRGAKVRVITDRTQAKGKGSLVGKIRDAGIPVVTNIKHKIEHNKFAVFDGKHVVSGSYNWTTNASMYNSENC